MNFWKLSTLPPPSRMISPAFSGGQAAPSHRMTHHHLRDSRRVPACTGHRLEPSLPHKVPTRPETATLNPREMELEHRGLPSWTVCWWSSMRRTVVAAGGMRTAGTAPQKHLDLMLSWAAVTPGLASSRSSRRSTPGGIR